MQIASRQPLWNEGGRGTVIEVEMTASTGLYIQVMFDGFADRESVVDWGAGSARSRFTNSGHEYIKHTYPRYGKYKIVAEGIWRVGLRDLDGRPQYAYDAAIISVVDYAGQITSSNSGGFKKAINLERFIAPNSRWMGQRDFAYCSKLKEVVIGKNVICYDGTYQYCSSLEKYVTESTGTCWSYVWQGCTKLKELKLGAVTQFATQDFQNCPQLMDIWISNKTVDQIMQKAPSGNIAAGYGAKFPWNANANCRFHGIDGVVLGNGTRIA